jgi:hypothetical protein
MMKKLTFAVFLVVLLTMAGCNSPPDQNAVKDTTPTQETGNDNGQTVTTVPGEEIATTLPEEIKPVDTKPDSGTDLKAQFMGLFTGGAKDYMVSYDTTVSGDGQPEYTASMAYYIKGDDKLRVDTLANMPGASDSRFYKVSGSFVMCNKQGGSWNCIKMPNQQDSSQDPKKQTDEIQKNMETSQITQLPDRVIAGVNAKCFQMIVSVNTEQAKASGLSTWENIYCVSADGVLLFSDSKNDKMHVVQEATSYVKGVADSEFVPPAQPKDISSGIPGVPGGKPTGYTLPDGVTMPEMPSSDN